MVVGNLNRQFVGLKIKGFRRIQRGGDYRCFDGSKESEVTVRVTTAEQVKLVDVTGFEPATPCLQNSLATSRNSRGFNHSIEYPKLSSPARQWLDGCECGRLHVGSLQKSLQSSAIEKGATA